MDEPSTAEVVPLTIQVIRGMEALAAGQRAISALVESGLAQSAAQGREHAELVRGNREAVLAEQRALLHATELHTAAIEARTGLLRELGQGALAWLERRWVTLLLGLAVGLGLAGAGELLRAVMGQMLGGG